MGFQKKFGKGRLDKYYRIAKQQGYRSRASFKLIQINKKYNVLQKANVVIDLCAAPGGWLQVCEKFCPYGSIKIGLDLDRIPPIPGCKTFQQDITTPECFSLLKKELTGKKADVVLNDGAPNVGSNWSKDAFAQIELTLSALKLACTFLRRGGSFITKVFRSTDYNALVYVMKKFFNKVEANKPLASRFTSAEIFVCCMDFIAPDIIDEKLFDPKYIFKDTESDMQLMQQQHEINSIDKIMEKRRKRQGYADDAPQMLSRTLEFEEFIKIENPFALFITHNKITLPKEEFLKVVEPPQFYDEYLDDIQLLGKREIAGLLKWRGKLRQKLKQQNHILFKKSIEEEGLSEKEEEDDEEEEEEQKQNGKKLNQKKQSETIIEEEEEEEEEEQEADEEMEDEHDLNDEDSEAGFNNEQEDEDDDEQIQIENEDEEWEDEEEVEQKQNKLKEDSEDEDNEEIRKLQQKELNEQRKARAKREKQISKQGVAVEFQGSYEDEGLFSLKEHKKLKKIGYIDVNEDEFEPKVTKIRMTQKDIEDNLETLYERSKNKVGKNQNKFIKESGDVNFNIEKIQCQTLEEGEEPKQLTKKEQKILAKQIANKSWYDQDLFKGAGGIYNNDGTELQQNSAAFDNPLSNKKFTKIVQDNISDDSDDDYMESAESHHEDYQSDDEQNDIYIDKQLTSKNQKKIKNVEQQGELEIDPNEKMPGELDDDKNYVLDVPQSEMAKRRKKLKRQQQRMEKKKAKQTEVHELNQPIEIVPETKIEDYDLDSLAETLALAKKMLRKRNREEIIDSTYSRYAQEDHELLPQWFVEDEKKHNFKHVPVTKEEMKAERERIKAINAQAPKKVIEAKIRKQKRLEKKMKKANKQAEEIFEQEGVSEKMKIEQAKKLYAKQKSQVNKEKEKKVVITRKFKTGKVNQGSKKVAFVDRRARKDVKNTRKQKNNQSTQSGNGGRNRSRTRQIKRKNNKPKRN